jgi:succinyl-diaminopimelate desuccinylase
MPLDSQSLLAQIQQLVRISSRGGVDDYDDVLHAIEDWLRGHGVPVRRLEQRGRLLGLCGEIRAGASGPTYLLNATVDTAPFGDPGAWSRDPVSGDIVDGWLFGRGSADSKAGVAIFCHVLASLVAEAPSLRGTMEFLFDAEEHSGRFSGVRCFMEQRTQANPLKGVMIGYPGQDHIVIGCRGFFRATLEVHGKSAHSGSSRHFGINAVSRAAEIASQIGQLTFEPPTSMDTKFPLPPRATVTAARGGGGFSTVPDLCRLSVDFRLTPSFTRADARELLRGIVAAVDGGSPNAPPTTVRELPGWPAYRTDDEADVYKGLRDAARQVLGRDLPGVVAGPSSVGNYLATLNIPSTSGFGVTYRNLHAADECIQIGSVEPTFQVYLTAARLLLR